jgi:hypothetical protein
MFGMDSYADDQSYSAVEDLRNTDEAAFSVMARCHD